MSDIQILGTLVIIAILAMALLSRKHKKHTKSKITSGKNSCSITSDGDINLDLNLDLKLGEPRKINIQAGGKIYINGKRIK